MQDGHELTEEFMDDALDQAREMGKRLSPDHACDMCARLDLQPPQDEELKRIAGWRIEDSGVPFFRSPPEPPTDGHLHFHNEVFDAFRNAWYEHAADPEECDVCLDSSLECEHERHDPDGCPV